MTLSFLINNVDMWWPIYKFAIMYNISVFIGAVAGSYVLKKILTLALFALTTRGTISFQTAWWINIYLHIKAFLTPIVFIAITWNAQLHKTVKPNESIIVDRILLNFNGASALLTPERHIVSLIMHKGVWLYFAR